MTEREFQKQVIGWLNRNNIMHLKTNVGLHYKKFGDKFVPFSTGTKGISDLLVFIKGQTIFIELKKDDGYLNENQKKYRDKIQVRGFLYVVLKPKMWSTYKYSLLN